MSDVSILVETDHTAMDAPNVPTATSPKGPGGPGVVSAGWLASSTTFESTAERKKLGVGLVASLTLHGLLLAIIVLLLAVGPSETAKIPEQFVKLVYMQDPGPGGGGGGSPAPAPPKPLEIPKHAAPPPPPLVPPPPVPIPPPPPPQLNAPIITTSATAIQAPGASSVSLQAYGGEGRGTGLGQGRGNGVGAGEGGGTGGGIYKVGSGIVGPKLLRSVQPKYTPDAMRAKIQGMVLLDAVVLSNGTVGDVKVARSLDPGGLDLEAIKAAKAWLFQPATNPEGKPVNVQVTLELAFRIF